MTSVYVTQTGQRYHARRDLSCLEKAHSIADIDLDTAVAGGLVPCLVCDAPAMPGVSEGDARWLRTIDDWAKAGAFESFWEQAFARRVLAQLPQVSSDDVETQAYVTVNGESYKVDFLLPSASLVLEIDGYAKDGAVPTAIDLERRNRRDSALQTAGYKVLHFTNAQVQQEPVACRSQVTAALNTALKAPPAAPPTTAPPTPTELTPTPPKAQPSEPIPATASPQTAAGASPMRSSTGLRIVFGIGVISLVVVAILAVVSLSPDGTGSPEVTTPPPSEFAAPLSNRECPDAYPLKGNINDSGEKIVHQIGQQFYDKTDPEACFATLDDAESAGYRPAQR
jgi:very-short-patch-repair endonuclease